MHCPETLFAILCHVICHICNVATITVWDIVIHVVETDNYPSLQRHCAIQCLACAATFLGNANHDAWARHAVHCPFCNDLLHIANIVA